MKLSAWKCLQHLTNFVWSIESMFATCLQHWVCLFVAFWLSLELIGCSFVFFAAFGWFRNMKTACLKHFSFIWSYLIKMWLFKAFEQLWTMKTASMKPEQKGQFNRLCRSTSMKPEQKVNFHRLCRIPSMKPQQKG